MSASSAPSLLLGEQLSFAQAARRLNIAQPALTRTIKGIEAVVGTQLLIRTTRRVQLTKPEKSSWNYAVTRRHETNSTVARLIDFIREAP
jgi:hypothetical protein